MVYWKILLLAWLYIDWLGENVDEIVDWKVPAVKLTVDVHTGAYDATIQKLNYLLYETPDVHKKATQVLDKMTRSLSEVELLGQQFNDSDLLQQSKNVRKNVAAFRQLFDQGVRALSSNQKNIEVLVANGNNVIEQADSFALKQEQAFSSLRLQQAPQALLNSTVQKYILVNRIKALAYTIIKHEKQERLYKNRQYYQKMQLELPELLQLYDQLQHVTQDAVELELIAVARLATQKYAQAADAWIAKDNELTAVVKEMNLIAADARKAALNAQQNSWQKMFEIGERTADLVSQSHLIIIVTLLFGAVVGVGLSLAITRTINESINALSVFSEKLGHGDLTSRVDLDSNDELGVVSRDLDRAASGMQHIIQQVKHNAQSLTEHANELSQMAENNSLCVAKQKEKTEQVADAMNSMAASVIEVAGYASHAAESANVASGKVNEGNSIASSSNQSISQLANEIELATSVIKELEGNVVNICSVLDVIRSISEQTNLLALNAAIEAARAGEHGRGFAVVADEVRTLASRTQSSTDEIQVMIEKLQNGTNKAVFTMNASHEMMVESVSTTKESGNALDSITQSILAINDINSQIAISAEQQKSVTGEINQSIVSISASSGETVETAKQTSQASVSLRQLATDLNQAISQFVV